MSMMNRLGNARNPYQGTRKKVLCVCSAGLLRSPTAALVLARDFDCNTRAAGCVKEYALIPVDQALLFWAEEIVCMEDRHAATIRDLLAEYKLTRDVLVLHVPDSYAYMDPELQTKIKDAYAAENT